ncbi:MAG TPA: AAA family ATPase [Anaerolineales bacterium]|nr:AAA family ATPase [Anaerolineales bacterium]
MMKLTAFKGEHFRCLFSTDWIPFSSLSIFTGENDGGKSTTLRALEIFLNPKITPLADDYSYCLLTPENQNPTAREDQIKLSGRFELGDSECAIIKQIWGVDDRTIEVYRVYQAGNPPSPYMFIAQTYDDAAFKKPLEDYTVPELKEIAQKFAINLGAVKNKQPIVDIIRAWVATQPKKPDEVILPDGLIACLPEILIFSSESALDPEKEIQRTLSIQFRSLIETEKYSGTISQIKTEVEADLNAELGKLAPFVKQYSNDVETLAIRPNFNFASGLTTTELELVRKDGRPILLQQSGAGQRRRFSLAVYEWSQEIFKNRDEHSRQLLMAFDEPDTHLDYKSQRQIFDTIKRFADLPAMQVVVCTHSLNFIERVPINQIVHYKLEPQTRQTNLEVLSIADHETTELFMYEISKNMGLRNSVMLHERCFLAIEGPTEIASLPVLFYKKYGMPLQSAGICLINGENNYGARMLVKFLNTNHRQVIFLVDTDSVTTDSTKKIFTPASFQTDGIDEGTQVYYIGVKEYEDAFSDDLWARMAQANYPKLSGIPWQSSDFASLRTNPKFSKAVQGLIQKDANIEEPSKLELGYKLAQCINIEEIPLAIVNCMARAYQLAN